MKKLENYMEVIVSEKIGSMLKDADCCKCNDCVLDVMAIALNDLPPLYAVSDTGKTIQKSKLFNVQSDTTVMVAVARAIRIVSDNPKHSENEEI